MEEYIYYNIPVANKLQELGINNYGAILLYSKILTLSNKYGYCTASNKYFANILSTTSRNIQRYILMLKKEKIISIYEEKERDYTVRKIYPKVTNKEINNKGVTKSSWGATKWCKRGDEMDVTPRQNRSEIDPKCHPVIDNSIIIDNNKSRYAPVVADAPLLTEKDMLNLEFRSASLSDSDMLEIIERKYLNYYSSPDYNNYSNNQLLEIIVDDFSSGFFNCDRDSVLTYGKYLLEKYHR